MITYRDVVSGLKQFNVGYAPVLAHVWMPAFGEVRGGASTLLGGLLTTFEDLVMPAFTYRTMLIPDIGPENNGMVYGIGDESNEMAEMFHMDLPVDERVGEVSELLRTHPHALRSKHPILSFSGINQDIAIQSQTIQEPLRPIGMLIEQNGWVLLMGVEQSSNISIHFAELLEGHPGFLRWALTHNGVVECPAFPGCERGFSKVTDLLSEITQQVPIGDVLVQGIELVPMMEVLTGFLRSEPFGLLCSDPSCLQCNAVRNSFNPNTTN
jgi:aminoglycoside 3-N-acetyltransferase